jgi:hypothetical protein
MMQQPSGGGS